MLDVHFVNIKLPIYKDLPYVIELVFTLNLLVQVSALLLALFNAVVIIII